ncbi:MAG: hypothetical protein ABFS46_12200 [Myxococcota bacterium]
MDEDVDELIAAAQHRTADEIRRLLADRRPRPDVPATMRRMAAPGETAADPRAPQEGVSTPRASEWSPGRDDVAPSPGAAPAEAAGASAAPTPEPRVRKEPLGGERYCVRFTADPEVHAQLLELQALMRHQIPDGDLAKIIGCALGALLERVRPRIGSDPRASSFARGERIATGSGRPGRLPARASHRSGRAQFTHPAPQGQVIATRR